MIKSFELYDAYHSDPFFNSQLFLEYNSYKNGSLSFIYKILYKNLEISNTNIIMNNNYHCKNFLIKWRNHLRNLLPTKLIKVDNENLFDIYETIEYIKNNNSKIKVNNSKFIYYITGISELRVYTNYNRTLIKSYDRCGEYTINLVHDNLLKNNDDYYIKTVLYKRYRDWIKKIDCILETLKAY